MPLLKSLLLSPVCISFLSLLVLTSCSGQDKKNSPESTPGQLIDLPYKDPLFFIEGQLCQHVRRIYQDRSGNLWFGTNVYGLMRYNGDTLEYFSEKDGLGMGRITAIVEDKEGNVWFGTYGGLTKYNPSGSGAQLFTNYPVKVGTVNNDIWSIAIDRNGIFWLGTLEGVVRFDGETFSHFPIPRAQVSDTTSLLSYNRISCILEDREGNLWFGTDGFGICKYDPSRGQADFTQITTEDGLCDNNIHALFEDLKGKIWIGTMFGGISRYDPAVGLSAGAKAFTNFTENGTISGVEAGGFFEDKTGHIWFAAENHGVYRYDGKSFTNFDTKDGLNTNGILSTFEDREGRFWLGGWGGLFRYDPSGKLAEGQSFVSVTKEGPWR